MLMMSRELHIRHLEESIHLSILSSTLTFAQDFFSTSSMVSIIWEMLNKDV